MKEQLISSMKRCVSAAGRPVFSIIIDESTDVSCTMVLACAVMYFDSAAQTKFLFTIDLEGERAVDLFAALSDGLKLNGFDISNIIGFAADTTKVKYDSPAHNILNHYEICWLSFHSCVARILEQWDALIAFFQEEYEI
ncbi:uncharacterized protein LOC123037243 [Drosophila rhopaloa]|uniref:Uncharacterized protein n=1 Tax=Drosophila rhopaloa TaxID=1041015 RepID=A0ABM5J2K1_DRORH|nr:uncharacterized protein LOC123037242 [Drosophila rhopaloa]XP_044313051.1 uncharacterized protein LOC123037243 [Drosophila rhopaloa]